MSANFAIMNSATVPLSRSGPSKLKSARSHPTSVRMWWSRIVRGVVPRGSKSWGSAQRYLPCDFS